MAGYYPSPHSTPHHWQAIISWHGSRLWIAIHKSRNTCFPFFLWWHSSLVNIVPFRAKGHLRSQSRFTPNIRYDLLNSRGYCVVRPFIIWNSPSVRFNFWINRILGPSPNRCMKKPIRVSEPMANVMGNFTPVDTVLALADWGHRGRTGRGLSHLEYVSIYTTSVVQR